MRHLCKSCGKHLRTTCPNCKSLNVRHNKPGAYTVCGNCSHVFHSVEVRDENCLECAVRLRKESQGGESI